MFDSIINLDTQAVFTLEGLITCTVSSLVLGLFIALMHMYKNKYNKNYVITLVLLPAIVQAVIMLVNGNLGTGVAVMGAFSLVRFRSIPGSARDINSIFFAMAIGIATGMGYIAFAFVFLILVVIVSLLLQTASFGEMKNDEKILKITIPENLDYSGVFDDLFEKYTSSVFLARVKTTNMGSMYQLTYNLSMTNERNEKAMIDELRCRNGNLEISLLKTDTSGEML